MGDAGAGFFRACTMSWRLFMMMSVEELGGIVTLVGNQVMVSQIRSALVSQIQMV
jgi:hypothetical protein